MAKYGMFGTDWVAFRICHALIAVAVITQRAVHDVAIELFAKDFMEDFTVMKATVRVKPIEQLLDKRIFVDRYPNLPVRERLTLRLFGEVLICDDIVFELRHCTSLTFQEADLLEELTHPGRCNDVKDVPLFA